MRRVLIACCFAALMVAALSTPRARADGFDSAPASNSPNWFWAQKFDRTPNSVRTRFNELSGEWASSPARGQRAKQPTIPEVLHIDSDGFAFADSNKQTPIDVGGALADISGQVGSDGKVNLLVVKLTPSGDAGTTYLRASDQLMQLSIFSLFDDLNRRASRSLTLTFIYDVRPFCYPATCPVASKTRHMQSVVDGSLIDLLASSAEDGSIVFQVTLADSPTSDQISAAASNNGCNRRIFLVNSQCADLVDCVRSLTDLVTPNAPRWDDIEATAEQVSDDVTAISSLANELSAYPKTAQYAAGMKAECDAFGTLNQSFGALVTRQSIDGAAGILQSMTDHAADMQGLMSLILG